MDLFVYNLLTFLLIVSFILGFVWIVMYNKRKDTDTRAKIILTAMDKGLTVDPNLLAPQKKKATNKWLLIILLVLGSGFTIFGIASGVIVGLFEMGSHNFVMSALLITIGVALLIGYLVGKRMLKPELEEETAQKGVGQTGKKA